ncbi:MAG TPA: thioredoxin-disulfide reductase [Myxococcota bacterium]|nr:thioredoxin-disulfide reductase [Myxococcota bacterium]HRY94692.1 thioredoxin-disulfide reductase [Myxococcota bacterium]HSA20270.1 thioredoxin-disulfide reductase [Myxococcota bacterium]
MGEAEKRDGEQPALHDVAILGGGAAGYAAAIYAGRARLSTLLVDGMGGGGQLNVIDQIENYPGFPEPISGPDLQEAMRKQAERFGVAVTFDQIEKVEPWEGGVTLAGAYGSYRARALLVATGAHHRELGVPGEERLKGRGVSYCATCDGNFFKDQRVVVVGGGDTAVKDAIYLSRLVRKLTLIHRRDKLRAEKVMQEKLLSLPNVEPRWDSVVEEVRGEGKVTGVRLKHVKTGAPSELEADGVFVFIGVLPNTALLRGVVELDPAGYVKTDVGMRTSHPHIFAAGDVRSRSVKQIAAAVGDGVTAMLNIQELLDSETPPRELPVVRS